MKSSDAHSTPLRVLHRGSHLVLGEVDAMYIAIWRRKPNFLNFRLQREHLARIVRQYPGRATLLCIVEAGSEPPDEPVRKASSAMIAEHGSELRRVACIIEGDDFRAAITRSVLSGMNLLLRSATKIKFFRSAPEGIEWLCSDAGATEVRHALSALELLRVPPGLDRARIAAGNARR